MKISLIALIVIVIVIVSFLLFGCITHSEQHEPQQNLTINASNKFSSDVPPPLPTAEHPTGSQKWGW